MPPPYHSGKDMLFSGAGSVYMPFWLAVVLGFAIVARSTRFVNSDVLAEPLRMWAEGIERPGARFRKSKRALRKYLRAVFGDDLPILFTCPWCLSIWFALPVAIVAVVLSWPYSHDWYAVLGVWLGYSYVYGVAANNLDG